MAERTKMAFWTSESDEFRERALPGDVDAPMGRGTFGVMAD